LSDRELARAVYADEQVELALGSLHFGNIDVEEADRVAFEALPLRFVAFDVRQAGDPVPLQASVQRGARQMRERRLQGVEAVPRLRGGRPAAAACRRNATTIASSASDRVIE